MWWWIGILVVAFGGPFVAVWWSHRKERMRFEKARMSELNNPQDATARIQLGELYLKHKKAQKALVFFEEALKIQRSMNNVSVRLLTVLSDALLRCGEQQRAYVLLDEASQKENTENTELFTLLGKASMQLSKTQEAKDWLQKACSSNRSAAEPIFYLAVLLYECGEHKEAKDLIDTFVQEWPSLPKFIQQQNFRWFWKMKFFPWIRFGV